MIDRKADIERALITFLFFHRQDGIKLLRTQGGVARDMANEEVDKLVAAFVAKYVDEVPL